MKHIESVINYCILSLISLKTRGLETLREFQDSELYVIGIHLQHVMLSLYNELRLCECVLRKIIIYILNTDTPLFEIRIHSIRIHV